MHQKAINPRDRIKVKDRDDVLTVYTVARTRPAFICVIVDGVQKWIHPDNVTDHQRAEPIAWSARDRFALRSGDGRVVRHGTLLEWVEREQHWYLEVDAEPHPTGGHMMDGFKTWLPGHAIVPVEETVAALPAVEAGA